MTETADLAQAVRELAASINRFADVYAERTARHSWASALEYRGKPSAVQEALLAEFAKRLELTDDDRDRIVNAEIYEKFQEWWRDNAPNVSCPSSRVFPRALRAVLGITDAENNPRKLGKGPNARLTWTNIRWVH